MHDSWDCYLLCDAEEAGVTQTMFSINKAVFENIFQFAGRNSFFDAVGVFFADYFVYLLFIGLIIFIFTFFSHWRSRWVFISALVLVVILGRGIITEGIRFFYDSPRPFVVLGVEPLIMESSRSFPSGHATFLFSIATIVFYFNRRWGSVFFVAATINGIARIFVGVHWPFDIVGGIVAGLLSGILVYKLIEPHFEGIKRKIDAVATPDGTVMEDRQQTE